LTKDTANTIDELGHTLDMEPAHRTPYLPKLRKSIWWARWDRVKGIRPQSTAMLGRHKGQQPAVWRRDFTVEDRRFFHQEAGDLLIELGYETSDAWVTDTKDR